MAMGLARMEEDKARSELATSLSIAVSAYDGRISQASREIVALWQRLKSGDQLPKRSDIRPEALAPWLGNIALVEVFSDPRRFRLRLVGTRIADVAGRDSTGKWFDELYSGADLVNLNEVYSASVDDGEPYFVRGNMRVAGKEFIEFDAIHLPFADVAGDICMIVNFIVFTGRVLPR
jgi:hypothetical protein